MKLLLLGPLPPPIGGATVLFKQLVDGLSENSDIELKVIDTSGKAKIGKVKLFLNVLISFLKQVKTVDVVSFHASLRGSLLFSPFIFIVCKYHSKPWVFRGFGGNYPAWYQGLPWVLQWLLKNTLLSANVENTLYSPSFRSFSTMMIPFCTSPTRPDTLLTLKPVILP